MRDILQRLDQMWSEDCAGPDDARAQKFTDRTLSIWRDIRTVLALVDESSEATVDGDELTCRIAEAMLQSNRPTGATAMMALDMIEDQSSMLPGFRRAAVAAVGYIASCVGVDLLVEESL